MNSTSVRGTSTSRSCRFPASNTSRTMCRSSSLSAWFPATRSRSSSSVITPRPDGRIAAEQPHHQVGGLRQQPHQRPGEHRDAVQHRRREQRDRLRALQREPLGGQLAEHQGEERDRPGDHDQRDRRRPPGGDVVGDQRRLQVAGQGGGAERAGEQGGHGDADLDRGQEPVGVLRKLRRPLAALAPLPDRAHLPLAQRDQGHFRPGEEPADEHDGQHDNDVPADLVHGLISDLRIRHGGAVPLLDPPAACPGPWPSPRRVGLHSLKGHGKGTLD